MGTQKTLEELQSELRRLGRHPNFLQKRGIFRIPDDHDKYPMYALLTEFEDTVMRVHGNDLRQGVLGRTKPEHLQIEYIQGKGIKLPTDKRGHIRINKFRTLATIFLGFVQKHRHQIKYGVHGST